MNMFTKMGTEINKGLIINDSEQTDLVALFKRIQAGDRRYMNRVITMAQFLSTQPEKRRELCTHLEQVNGAQKSIQVAPDSFYSIKEFLNVILHSCIKAEDEYVGLKIIRYSQNYEVNFQKDDKNVTRRMGSFYYSHPIVRRIEFWVKSFVDMFEVKPSLIHSKFPNFYPERVEKRL